MKLGIILSQTEPETVFNALRLANFSLKQGDAVKIFLMGKGVELDQIEDAKFNVREQAQAVHAAGGQFLACGTCLKLRSSQGSELCPLSTMKDSTDRSRLSSMAHFDSIGSSVDRPPDFGHDRLSKRGRDSQRAPWIPVPNAPRERPEISSPCLFPRRVALRKPAPIASALVKHS